MASFKTILTAFAITSINTLFLLPYSINAARFDIINKCSYTVWAAAVLGGGRKLDRGQSWPLDVNAGTVGRIWARTNCKFNGDSGHCETGDCGGLLECRAHGTPPNTLAKYALNQYNNQDMLDLSVVEGFNVPMEFSPTSGQCSKGIKCTADINGQCPSQLRTSGGCNALFLKQMNSVVLKGEVLADQQPSPGFSKTDALMRIAILKMSKPVVSFALVGRTIRSSSAHELQRFSDTVVRKMVYSVWRAQAKYIVCCVFR